MELDRSRVYHRSFICPSKMSERLPIFEATLNQHLEGSGIKIETKVSISPELTDLCQCPEHPTGRSLRQDGLSVITLRYGPKGMRFQSMCHTRAPKDVDTASPLPSLNSDQRESIDQFLKTFDNRIFQTVNSITPTMHRESLMHLGIRGDFDQVCDDAVY